MTEHQYKVVDFCLKAGCSAKGISNSFGADLIEVLKVQSTNSYKDYIAKDGGDVMSQFNSLFGL